MNSVAVHPARAAREIFDYMNNHYFDCYGGSAWTTRKDTVRNCTWCVYWNRIIFCCSKHFLFSETKSFNSKKGLFDFIFCRASEDKLRTTHTTFRSCLLARSFDPTTLIEVAVYSMGQRHECGFYRNRVSEFWPLAIEYKKYRLIQKKFDFIQYSYFR